jgi:ribosome biogenesis protein MAK21
LQDSVIANLKSFDILLSWVQKRKGGKDVVRQAIEALQELCLTVVLPDRKLKYLEQQPVDALPEGKEGKKQLLMWCVEDAVKRRYNMLVTALEECTRDNLEFLKEKATKVRTSSSCHCPVIVLSFPVLSSCSEERR